MLCPGMVSVLCRTQRTAHTLHTSCTVCFNISVTLARLKHKLPDDGRRPKHVGAILM
jgi:hypothetical protein